MPKGLVPAARETVPSRPSSAHREIFLCGKPSLHDARICIRCPAIINTCRRILRICFSRDRDRDGDAERADLGARSPARPRMSVQIGAAAPSDQSGGFSLVDPARGRAPARRQQAGPDRLPSVQERPLVESRRRGAGISRAADGAPGVPARPGDQRGGGAGEGQPPPRAGCRRRRNSGQVGKVYLAILEGRLHRAGDGGPAARPRPGSCVTIRSKVVAAGTRPARRPP